MRRFIPLLAFVLAAAACGAPTEPTAEAQAALIPAPYVCPTQSSVNPWPGTGDCAWMPSNGVYPSHVQGCTTSPGWAFVQVYFGKNYTGNCAAIWTYGGYQGPNTLVENADTVQLSGWLGNHAKIQSIKVGTGDEGWGSVSTSVRLSSGPDPLNNAYHSTLINNTGTASRDYPDILAVTGHDFAGPIYSFALEAH